MMTPFENNAKCHPCNPTGSSSDATFADLYSNFIHTYIEGVSTVPSYLEGLVEDYENNEEMVGPSVSSSVDARGNHSSFGGRHTIFVSYKVFFLY